MQSQKILPIIANTKAMVFTFEKYEGAGNDFVMIDDRNELFDVHNEKFVQHLCGRHFGIGADGLILLRTHPKLDFQMIYFNSDGKLGSMCGNGGRCIAAFAKKHNIIKERARFSASDGIHEVYFHDGVPVISMGNVSGVEQIGNDLFIDTGSPHYIRFVDDPEDVDLIQEAKTIRYNDRFREKGTNFNLVAWDGEVAKIRTYERGVENETLACGTGVTAAAIALYHSGRTDKNEIDVRALGGGLKVFFEAESDRYSNVWLSGPAKFVFRGEFENKG